MALAQHNDSRRVNTAFFEFRRFKLWEAAAAELLRGYATVGQAMKLLDDRIATDPTDRLALMTRGNLGAFFFDAATALDDLAAAVAPALASHDTAWESEVWALFASALVLAERETEALEALETALSLDPYSVAALRLQTMVRQGAGHVDAAMAGYVRYLAIEPLDDEATFNYGLLLIEKGENDEACRLYYAFHEAGGVYPEIAESLAWLAWQKGETARALPVVERALAEKPDGSWLSVTAHQVYATLGRYPEALQHARNAHRLNPKVKFQSYRCHTPISV